MKIKKIVGLLSVCLNLYAMSMHCAVAQQGPPPTEDARGGPGGPPPGKEEPITAPPTDLNPVKLLIEGQRAFISGKYADVVDKYANPIINYYAYRYGTRGRRMFVAHDASEAAVYEATGARVLDLSTNDGVLNGASLPPEAVKGSRNIVVPEGTLSDAFALKAKALAKQGKTEDALQMLTRSTVLSPNYPTYWNDIGELYVQIKRCDDAANAYMQAEEMVKRASSEVLKKEQSARTRRGRVALAKCKS